MSTAEPITEPAPAPTDEKPARRKGGVSLGTILFTLLLVGSLTLAGVSTWVAMRMATERKQADEERARALAAFESTSQALDQMNTLVFTDAKLKAAEPARLELLQPFLAYYQGFIQAHASDKKNDFLPQLSAAYFRSAALQAKMGSKDSVQSITKGVACLSRMRLAGFAADKFPSIQTCALRLVPTLEWGTLKEGTKQEREKHGISLFLAVTSCCGPYEELAKVHPQTLSFRDDLAALRRILGLFNTLFNRNKEALYALDQTSQTLETLVRDAPTNNDYKSRLAETLVSAGKLQKTKGDADKAIASYERAVALRTELAAAAPDDKTYQQDLKTAQRDLERLKAAPPAAKKEAAPAATAEATEAEPAATQ